MAKKAASAEINPLVVPAPSTASQQHIDHLQEALDKAIEASQPRTETVVSEAEGVKTIEIIHGSYKTIRTDIIGSVEDIVS